MVRVFRAPKQAKIFGRAKLKFCALAIMFFEKRKETSLKIRITIVLSETNCEEISFELLF